MYYDINKTLSRQRLFNFVIGARGVGKTYAAKKRAIDNFLKKGEQFIYIRRFETEMPAAEMLAFFSDIQKEYEDHEFKSGKGLFKIDGLIAGWYVALTKAPMLKSIPFPNVSLIVFDEFIIETGVYQYLPNEVRQFLDLYSTIARDRDVTVLFMSNAVTMTNPYFIYFDLNLEPGQTVKLTEDMSLEMVRSPDYAEHMKQTRFGRMIKNTPYGDYAIENKFLLDNDNFVEKLSEHCEYLCTLKIEDREYGYYNDRFIQRSYVSDKVDASCKNKIAITLSAHKEDTVLAMRCNYYFTYFIQQFQQGNLRFTTSGIRNQLYPHLKKLL